MGIGDWGLGIGDWGLGIGPVNQEYNVVINVYVVKILLKLLWKHIQ